MRQYVYEPHRGLLASIKTGHAKLEWPHTSLGDMGRYGYMAVNNWSLRQFSSVEGQEVLDLSQNLELVLPSDAQGEN